MGTGKRQVLTASTGSAKVLCDSDEVLKVSTGLWGSVESVDGAFRVSMTGR